MSLRDRISKLKLLRDKAGKYSSLDANLDFNDWRQDVVEKRLLAYAQNALNANLETPEGQSQALNQLRSYQQLKYVTQDVFTVWRFAEAEAIKKIQKLEKNENSDQPIG